MAMEMSGDSRGIRQRTVSGVGEKMERVPTGMPSTCIELHPDPHSKAVDFITNQGSLIGGAKACFGRGVGDRQLLLKIAAVVSKHSAPCPLPVVRFIL